MKSAEDEITAAMNQVIDQLDNAGDDLAAAAARQTLARTEWSDGDPNEPQADRPY
jgi:F0F1-type ATP synthase membrane subunit b/b'